MVILSTLVRCISKYLRFLLQPHSFEASWVRTKVNLIKLTKTLTSTYLGVGLLLLKKNS